MKQAFLCILFLVFISFASADDLPCLMCHTTMETGVSVHPTVEMGCAVCHIAPHENDQPELSLSAEVPDLCFACHDNEAYTRKNQHTAVAGGNCTSCHNPHASPNKVLLVSPRDELCFFCHNPETYEKEYQHKIVKAGECITCHDPHSSEYKGLLITSGDKLCFSCHDASAFAKKVAHQPVASGECTACHDPHASDFRGMVTMASFDLCASCHKEQTSGKHVVSGYGNDHPLTGGIDPSRSDREFSCTSCHDPHGSGIVSLFPDRIQKADNLCFLCHSKG